jgi:hypothetical protein
MEPTKVTDAHIEEAAVRGELAYREQAAVSTALVRVFYKPPVELAEPRIVPYVHPTLRWAFEFGWRLGKFLAAAKSPARSASAAGS